MTNKLTLAPKVVEYAQLIYMYLGLPDKRKDLPNAQALPTEIEKMRLLCSTDPTELTKVVHQFIVQSQQPDGKRTLDDFIKLLDKSLDCICQDEPYDEFDDFGLDEDEFLLEIADQTMTAHAMEKGVNKRPFDTINTSTTTEPIVTNKRLQKDTGPIHPKSLLIDDYASTSSTTSSNIGESLSPSPSVSSTSTSVSTPLTHSTTPDLVTPTVLDNEHFLQTYQKQLQQEKTAFPGDNLIASPIRRATSLKQAPWILLFELARILSICQISWDHLDLEATQALIDLTKRDPERVHDAILKWLVNLRRPGAGELGLMTATANGSFDSTDYLLKLVSIERCSDLVWKFGSSINTQHNDKPDLDSTCSGTNYDRHKLRLMRYQDNKVDGKMHQTRSIHYTATLFLPKDLDEQPRIKLNAPQFQASNRFFRKYGAERFLELRLARTAGPSDPLNEHKSYILRPFLLMGVTYQFLFMKDDRLILFATKGPGLTFISIKSVIEWHIPLIHNWGLTICKFASRMSLGYSNSIPTLTFEPHNVRLIDDIYAKGRIKGDNTCMTDGCGIISAAAMKKIMGTQQNDILPCAVQGRIGGAKGVWIVTPDLDLDGGDWIEIRASQNKFKTGEPGPNMKVDPLHYTFDLVKNAFCIYPCYLNTQFIQCLSAGGVPTSVFVDLLKDHIGNMAEIISDNKNNRLLRDWLVKEGGLMNLRQTDTDTGIGLWQRQKVESMGVLGQSSAKVSDNPEEMNDELGGNAINNYSAGKASRGPRFNRHSGNPYNLFESIVRYLDAGFDLSNPFMASRISSVFRLMMETLSTKYRVQVKQSCSLMCVPDPTGTLKPNQVFLQMSSRKKDEQTGIHAGLITGDILVARSPCGMKSDVQKVEAVDNSALRIYSDVIVFPIQGSRSLASKLSGGDYDGDLIFCCWDKRLVDTFIPSEVPKKTEEVDAAFEKDTRTVRDTLRTHRYPDEQERELQRLFLSVPTYDGTLGVYENWRTVVSEITSLDDHQVIYLAQMCALLVDAPKQGLWVKPWTKKEDRAKFGVHHIPKWFADKLNKLPDDEDDAPSTITLLERPLTTAMDHLHETIRTEIESLTQRAQNLIPTNKAARMDPDLSSPWYKACEAATELGDDLMLVDLRALKDAVNANLDSYIQGVRDVTGYIDRTEEGLVRLGPFGDDDDDDDDDKTTKPTGRKFRTFLEVEDFHAEHFFGIGQKGSLDSVPFKTDLLVNEGRMVTILKASYAYIRTIEQERYSKYCYVVAYDALARMKSDANAKKIKPNGLSSSLVPSVYPAMTMDRQWIRKEKEVYQLNV